MAMDFHVLSKEEALETIVSLCKGFRITKYEVDKAIKENHADMIGDNISLRIGYPASKTMTEDDMPLELGMFFDSNVKLYIAATQCNKYRLEETLNGCLLDKENMSVIMSTYTDRICLANIYKGTIPVANLVIINYGIEF